MADNPELVSQFMAITGADDDRAKFYLESSANKLDVAIARYYETDAEQPLQDLPSASPPAQSTRQTTPPRPKSKTTNSTFATINSLASSSDEDDDAQAFYAGGSEHSGQQVLGPPKKPDFVQSMFKSVRKHGVEVVEQRAGASGSSAFRGAGYKLGQTADDSVQVAGAQAPARAPEAALKLWKDGFSVNDGELRAYTDPANADFLRSIQRGEIPLELRQDSAEVYLSMEDHRAESYRAERPRRAFAGQGYTLGNPAPAVVGAQGEEDKPANEAKAKEGLNVDAGQPTTNIQIRLADGARLVAQFNHTHTVGDLRNYIVTARPQYAGRQFNLLSGYPTRVLNDSEGLAEANLLNSAIMQKLV